MPGKKREEKLSKSFHSQLIEYLIMVVPLHGRRSLSSLAERVGTTVVWRCILFCSFFSVYPALSLFMLFVVIGFESLLWLRIILILLRLIFWQITVTVHIVSFNYVAIHCPLFGFYGWLITGACIFYKNTLYFVVYFDGLVGAVAKLSALRLAGSIPVRNNYVYCLQIVGPALGVYVTCLIVNCTDGTGEILVTPRYFLKQYS